MMTELVKGHSLAEAQSYADDFTRRMTSKEPAPEEIEEELDALQGVKKYPARVKCAMLPWTTLREVVDLYHKRES
jgi:nitrogen fixation NifU-like protein